MTTKKVPSKPAARKPKTKPPSMADQRVLVAVTQTANADDLVALLGRIAPDLTVSVADLSAQALAAHSDGPVIVLIDSAGTELTRSMRAGAAPNDALSQWVQNTQTHLNTLRLHRQNIAILDPAVATYAPAECAQALAARFGLTLDAAGVDASPLPEPDCDEAVLRLRSQALLANDLQGSETADELAAMSLLAPSEVSSDALLAVISDHLKSGDDARLEAKAEVSKALGVAAAAQAKLDKAEQDATELRAALDQNAGQRAQEVELLTDALQQVQSHADGETAKIGLEKSRAKVFQSQIADLKDGQSIREETLAAALLHIGQEMDQIKEELRAAYVARNQTASVLEVAHADLERIYTSNSWKVTNPLRKIRSFTQKN